MNKKILITGGTGFIGKSLVEHFSNRIFFPLKKNVWAPTSSELNLLDSEKVYQYIKDHKFDVIIHAATYDAVPEFSTKEELKQLENNIRMFFNIVRARKFYGKMIYFGSGAVYDRDYLKPKMTEDYAGENIPSDQYGFSKYIMSKYAAQSDFIYNLRLFGVFGKFDDWRYRFISNACCKAVLGLPITIKQNVFFDYLYMNDLSRIVEWFVFNDSKDRVFNTCSGKTIDYVSLAKKLISISSKDLEIIVEKEGLRPEYSGDNSLLIKNIEKFEPTPFDNSLEELYDWYDQNKKIIDPSKFIY